MSLRKPRLTWNCSAREREGGGVSESKKIIYSVYRRFERTVAMCEGQPKTVCGGPKNHGVFWSIKVCLATAIRIRCKRQHTYKYIQNVPSELHLQRLTFSDWLLLFGDASKLNASYDSMRVERVSLVSLKSTHSVVVKAEYQFGPVCA